MAPVFLRQLPVGPMQNFAYLVGGAHSSECVIVDPGWQADAILAAAAQEGRALRAIVLTHGHFDHVGAVADLLSQAAVPVMVHEADAHSLKGCPGLQVIAEGQTVEAGGLRLECLHTPGHTPGSVCLLGEGQLFTGDTLFLDCCGRTDLEGSDPRAMHRSLRRLAALPPATVVWSGHDYGSKPSASLAEVLKMNPYLAAEDLQAFLRMQG